MFVRRGTNRNALSFGTFFLILNIRTITVVAELHDIRYFEPNEGSITGSLVLDVGRDFAGHVSLQEVEVDVHPSPIPDISEHCQTVLKRFALSVANFTSCTARHARPITVCLSCINQYQKVKYWFWNISSDSDAHCDQELLNRDRLLVVQNLFKQAGWFWETAQCKHCFSQDDKQPPELCNNTKTFFKHLQLVKDCINRTEIIFDIESEGENKSAVCDQCQGVYTDLNAFYDHLNTEYNNRLCMDLIDEMNITRHMWSSRYKCNSLKIEGFPVLLTSAGFLILPFIYYCSNRFVAIAKDTKLVHQKRMSFVQTSHSSANLQR